MACYGLRGRAGLARVNLANPLDNTKICGCNGFALAPRTDGKQILATGLTLGAAGLTAADGV